MACGYLTSMALLVAQRGPEFARRYDVKLRKLAAASEELAVEDVVPLFHKLDANVVAEVLVDVNLDNPKIADSQPAGQPRGSKGGQPRGGNKRPRDEANDYAGCSQGSWKGVPKGCKSGKGGSNVDKQPDRRGRGGPGGRRWKKD